MSTISIESKPVSVTGLNHLYLVFQNDFGKEFVIRGGPQNDTAPIFGPIVLEVNEPIESSEDNRGALTPADRGHLEINLGERSAESVWKIMMQQAINIYSANLDYNATIAPQNSNSAVASILNSVGIDIADTIPLNTIAANLPGISNLLSFNTSLVGMTANDLIQGYIGNDTLNGGVGIDTMIGGTGNDTYVVDNTGDVVTETSTLTTEIDTVKSSVAYTLKANVENLTLTGTLAINATGNALKNTLTGNAVANVLNGGIGADKMIGGLGNDTYVVDNTGDVVTENSALATEIDTIKSSVTYTLKTYIENITLTGTLAINGTGNALKNVLTGNTKANVLLGGVGNDTLNGGGGNDVLNGGSDIDTMTGGAGNDTYYVDSSSDVVTESSAVATEIDKVNSSISYTLGTTLENLTLTGTKAINGTGNSLNNTLTGNSMANETMKVFSN
jgi:Ca2+-binding RTX toxin-like protein